MYCITELIHWSYLFCVEATRVLYKICFIGAKIFSPRLARNLIWNINFTSDFSRSYSERAYLDKSIVLIFEQTHCRWMHFMVKQMPDPHYLINIFEIFGNQKAIFPSLLFWISKLLTLCNALKNLIFSSSQNLSNLTIIWDYWRLKMKCFIFSKQK